VELTNIAILQMLKRYFIFRIYVTCLFAISSRKKIDILRKITDHSFLRTVTIIDTVTILTTEFLDTVHFAI